MPIDSKASSSIDGEPINNASANGVGRQTSLDDEDIDGTPG